MIIRVVRVVASASIILTLVSGAARGDEFVRLTRRGCSVVTQNHDMTADFDWDGKCVDGYLEGPGDLMVSSGSEHIRYQGMMEKGMMSGFGTAWLRNGDQISAVFDKNKPQSPVVYNGVDGSRYIGDWLRGPDGVGQKTYANRTTYIGQWHDGEYSGFGIYRKSDGSEYVGAFSGNKFDGQGTLKTRDGDVFIGGWKAGAMDGLGQIKTHDGLSYMGELANGQRNGFGLLKSTGGDEFSGFWENDLPQGEGVLTRSDKTAVRGQWSKGCLQLGQNWLTAFTELQNCGK